MRTTIDFQSAILERARRRAAKRGVTLSELVCEAVSAYLAESGRHEAEDPLDLITCGEPGGYAPSPAEMSEAHLDDSVRVSGRERARS